MCYVSDKLKQCTPSRIVNVASLAHKWSGPLDVTNLNGEKFFDKNNAYQASKLALVTYTRELAKRLDGTGLSVYRVDLCFLSQLIKLNVLHLFAL